MTDVTDKQIAELVGLSTYKALYARWPKLYTAITYPMTPMLAYVQLVEALLPSDSNNVDQIGVVIRKDLIRMVKEGTDNLGYASSLPGSSPIVKQYRDTPTQSFFYYLWIVIWSLFVCVMLWKIGFVHLLLHPRFVGAGLGIDILT